MQSAALQRFFQVERDHCNLMVASVRHQSQSLDTDAFSWFLSSCLDPLMVELDEAANPIAFPVALAGYKHGLELAALNWLKNETKQDALLQLWSGFYPRIIDIVKQDPAATFTEIGNLLSHLFGIDHAHPRRWLEAVSGVADRLEDRDQLKRAGLVCAWMAGLAHYRRSALSELAKLPEVLVKTLLQLPDGHDTVAYLAELAANRWLSAPAQPGADSPSSPALQTRVGQCLQLGGDLPQPPRVSAVDDRFIVESGGLAWQLHVDVYGSILLPCDPQEANGKSPTGRQKQRLAQLASTPGLEDIEDLSSAASLPDAIAVTSVETFAVLILSAIDSGQAGAAG